MSNSIAVGKVAFRPENQVAFYACKCYFLITILQKQEKGRDLCQFVMKFSVSNLKIEFPLPPQNDAYPGVLDSINRTLSMPINVIFQEQ